MIRHVDMFGHEVLPGDYVAFAQRHGNSQRMAIAVVLKLDPNDAKSARLWSGAMGGAWNHETKIWGPIFVANSKPTTTSRLDECIVLPMDAVSFSVREAIVKAGAGNWFSKEAKV